VVCRGQIDNEVTNQPRSDVTGQEKLSDHGRGTAYAGTTNEVPNCRVVSLMM